MKTSQFASIAAAAAAGALFMYYVDSKRGAVGRGTAGDDEDRHASAAGGRDGSAEVVEHPTAPARSAWNEQGV